MAFTMGWTSYENISALKYMKKWQSGAQEKLWIQGNEGGKTIDEMLS